MLCSVQEVLLFVVPCAEVEICDRAVELFGCSAIVEVPVAKEKEAISTNWVS